MNYITKFKSIFNRRNNNYFFLLVISFSNIVQPLIIMPYLLSVLHLKSYGLLAYYQYIAYFFLVIFDFGIPLYATPKIAQLKSNVKELSLFITSLFCIQIIIISIVLLISFLIIFTTIIKLEFNVLMFSGFVLNSVFYSLTPNWIFQGLEINKKIITPILIGKLISILLILYFVKSDDNIEYVSYIYMLGSIITFGLSFLIIKRYFKLVELDKTLLLIYFKETMRVFLSRVIIKFYVTASPILVKINAGMEGVAIYSLCERVLNILRIPYDNFALSNYPIYSLNNNFSRLRITLIYLLLSSILIYYLSYEIIAYLTDYYGIKYYNFMMYFKIYNIALLFISVHTFLGTCVLMVKQKYNYVSYSIMFGLALYVIINFTAHFFISNMVLIQIIAMVGVEFGILVSRLYYTKKIKII